VLNVTFLLEPVVGRASPAATTVVSDLSISGHPWSWVFRAGDVGSALALLALAALGWRAGSATRWRLGIVLLAVFALSTLLAVVFPEQCAAAATACPAHAGPAWGDVLHDTISTLGTTCGVVSAGVFAWAVHRRRWKLEAALHAAAFVVAGGLGLLFVWAQSTGHDAWVGWPQRAQIVTLSLWFVLVGTTVARTGGPTSRGHRAT
jgi:hypothetical membrane protein